MLSPEQLRAYARVMKTVRALAPLLVAAALLSGSALAQPFPPPPANGGRLDVHPMNFDLWCQENQRLPPDRCDKRLPDDETAFEAYRAKIEKFEVPYLKDKQNEQTLNRAIIHADPVESPVDPSLQPPAPNP